MSRQNQAGIFITGLAIGSAIGTVIGLLVAPRTGKETRKVIEKSADALPELAEDLASSISLQSSRLSSEARQNWQETINRLQKAIVAGQEASQWEQRSSNPVVQHEAKQQKRD